MRVDWELIGKVTKALDIPYAKLIDDIRDALSEIEERKLDIQVERFLKAQNIASQESLIKKIIANFYSKQDLQKSGLYRYVVRTEGTENLTTLAVKSDWLELSLPLDRGQESYTLLSQSPDDDWTLEPGELAKKLVMLEARGIQTWDDPIYRLIDIDLSADKLDATFCLDRYFHYRFLNGSMQDELIDALIDANFSVETIVREPEKFLPLRCQFLPTSQHLLNPTSRVCGGGINVLTAIARPEPYQDFGIILQRRSSRVSSRQGALATIPGGHHQPTVSPSEETAISNTVFRELFEELFGGDQVQRRTQRLRPDWYKFECPPVAWLDSNKNSFELCLTGFGYSLITGSYSLSILLAIKDEIFWEQYSHLLQTNWEITNLQNPILSSKDTDYVVSLLKDESWTDYALFNFVESFQQLKHIAPQRVSLPEFI